MFKDKKVIVVMPAYNAENTLLQTHAEVLAQDYVDLIIVVDDVSRDRTIEIASSLARTKVYTHENNLGYGGNQKTCYKHALEEGADIVIMVHPDYQYSPKLIPPIVWMIGSGLYDCVLGSRILGGHALKGGMPIWKYIANRALTFAENLLTGAKLSEYHTGYRGFSRRLLQKVPFGFNSDDFVFDNQMILQVLWFGFVVAEVCCPTRYFADASSINFWRSVKYGAGCIKTAVEFRLAKMKIINSNLFQFPED
jgi:glycosyltransferase involved in cell wall biosynthesis